MVTAFKTMPSWKEELSQRIKHRNRMANVLSTFDWNERQERINLPSAVKQQSIQQAGATTIYESLPYETSTSRVSRKLLASNFKYRCSSKWVIFCCIGIAVGLMVYTVSSSILALSLWHRDLLLNDLANVGSIDSYHSHLSYHFDVFQHCLGYLLVAVSCVIIGSGIFVYMIDDQSGSGVPSVMAYLNGVSIPRVFNIRTLIYKFLSVILCVGIGIPGGSLGPLISMGAAFAAGISQGRSKSLRCNTVLFEKFRNPSDMRDFVTLGVACGVAGAFKAPVGGLLFAMEEVSSWWSPRLTWMILFACVLSTFIGFLLNSYYTHFVMLEGNINKISSYISS